MVWEQYMLYNIWGIVLLDTEYNWLNLYFLLNQMTAALKHLQHK